jgi:hypothetical protein
MKKSESECLVNALLCDTKEEPLGPWIAAIGAWCVAAFMLGIIAGTYF